MAHGNMVTVLTADVAVIGGTGIGDRLKALGGSPVCVPTPFGPMRGNIIEAEGRRIVVVHRHSAGHKTPPHAVPYEALAVGLKSLRVKGCLSSAAVGSLREDWPTGTFATCTDFLDLTNRSTTVFQESVRHTDFTTPFPLSSLFSDAKTPCVYACMDGPRYETPFEVGLIRNLGADVVGMTAASEAIAMRECGIAYGCLAVVTNLAAGISASELSHQEVGDAMESCGEAVVAMLLSAAKVVR